MKINSNPQRIANYSVQFRKNGKFSDAKGATHWYFKMLPRGKKWYRLAIPKDLPKRGRKKLVLEQVHYGLGIVDAQRRKEALKRKARKEKKRLEELGEEIPLEIEKPTKLKGRKKQTRGVLNSPKYGATFVFEGIEFNYTNPFKITQENSQDFMDHFRDTVLQDILTLVEEVGLKRGDRFMLRLNGAGEYVRLREGKKTPDLFGISTSNRSYEGEEDLLEDIYDRLDMALNAEKSYLTRMVGTSLSFNGFYIERYIQIK